MRKKERGLDLFILWKGGKEGRKKEKERKR